MYQASIMLSGFGYGAQAGMLNRSLFEDMAVAHWVKLNPVEAPELYERHRQHTMARMKETYATHEREDEFASWPALEEDEREELDTEFARKHHWTKLSLHALVKAIESEFKDENVDRRLLWQMFDISHRFNNLILHHSFFGLGLAARRHLARSAWTSGLPMRTSSAHCRARSLVTAIRQASSTAEMSWKN